MFTNGQGRIYVKAKQAEALGLGENGGPRRENEGPHPKQRRPFFLVFIDSFSENARSEDMKTFFWSSPTFGGKK